MYKIVFNGITVGDLSIPMTLMWRDQKVAKLTLEIYRIGYVSASTDEIYNETMLPKVIAENKRVFAWLIKRGMLRKSRRNIHFGELVMNHEDRNEETPFILSLTVNAVSLADKFWLNPDETVSFDLNGAKIVFQQHIWETVNPFRNLYHQGEIDQYGLCETFLFARNEPLNPKSLIWSTQGWANRRWVVENGICILEKQLWNISLENELNTFELFKSNGILIPEYEVTREKYNKEKHVPFYSLIGHEETINVIRKKCLTDDNSHLERLYEHINQDDTIESAVRRMCKLYNVDKQETERFIVAIKKYQEQYEVKDFEIENRNIGLLVNDNEAKPVVWGRLKLSWDPFFKVLRNV